MSRQLAAIRACNSVPSRPSVWLGLWAWQFISYLHSRPHMYERPPFLGELLHKERVEL